MNDCGMWGFAIGLCIYPVLDIIDRIRTWYKFRRK